MKSPISAQTEQLGEALAMKLFVQLGFAFRAQSVRDFGIDAHAELIENEKPTGRLLAIQLKSGSSYFAETTEDAFVFRIDAEHIKYWLNHSLPVLICLCDVDQSAIYWEHVNSTTAISTGKGYKINVPKSRKLVSEATAELSDILTPIVPPDRYTLTPIVSPDRYTLRSTRDQSHGTAKRYEIKAILNHTLSRAEIVSVVRQLTNDGAKRRYHRNYLTEARWGDSDAHVVWTFVYPTVEDYERNNFICRSLWMNDDLPQESRPFAMQGENIGDGIIVDWNQDYEKWATFLKAHESTKEAYFSDAIPLYEELISLSESVATELKKMSLNEITETAFLLPAKGKMERINEIYREIGDLPLPPVECGDVNLKLLELSGWADDIALFYSDTGMAKWDERSRLSQSLERVAYLQKTAAEFNYELEKVR